VETNTQRFFTGHTDDIVSLCLHPEGNLVASGQIGKFPVIIIWNAFSMKKERYFRDCAFSISLTQHRSLKGFHTNAVSALSFSKDGTLLVSVGADAVCAQTEFCDSSFLFFLLQRHSVAVWEWKKRQLLTTAEGHNDTVL
jgi:microtubule-associated protein-like 6